MPRLSVIVPFYGVETYIDRCLRSIAHQTFDDLEVVLVDDGSPDRSIDAAERWAERDPRFRVVRQDNQGLGPARNTGVRHATGELLAFVDSDDLLTRHAYQLLVGALDRSGSDLAAGNARRFTSLWARQSYTHARPFEQTVLATHVTERPDLVLDRMAWNKVYRRDLWERHAFAFPAMLYEDYPVTLPAHLAARSVDVLSDPVYFWREREGGELSITQAHQSLPNLRDRVASAEMVLAHVATHAPELSKAVEAHLFHADLDAIIGSLHTTEPADVDEVFGLARRLLAHVRGSVRADGRPMERLQAALVERSDVDRLLWLVEYRDLHGKGASVVRTSRFPARYAYDLPFRTDASSGLPARIFEADRPQVEVFARVKKARWRRGRLRIRGQAYLPGVPLGPRTRTSFWLEHADGTKISLEHTSHEAVLNDVGKVPVGFTVEVNPYDLGPPGKRGRWRLRCEVRAQGIRRTGPVTVHAGTRAGWLDPEPVGRDVVVQPVVGSESDVVLDVRRARTRVVRVSAFSDRVEVEGTLARPADDLALVLTTGLDERHEVPVEAHEHPDGSTRFVATVDLAALDPWPWAPDPMEEVAPWSVRLRVDGVERRLPVGPTIGVAVARSATLQMVASRTVRGRLGFTVGPIAGTLSQALWDDDVLVVEGGTAGPWARSARIRLVCQLDPVRRLVEEVPAVVHRGVFTARIPVGALLARNVEADVALERLRRTRVWQAAIVEDGVAGRLLLPRALLESAPPAAVLGGVEAEVLCGRASSFSIQLRGEMGSATGAPSDVQDAVRQTADA